MNFEKRTNPELIDEKSFFDEEVKTREVLEKYIIHWKWFLFSIIVFIGFGFFFIKMAKPQFEVTSTIFIDEEESGGLGSELSAFDDIGLVGGNKTSIVNEIGVLNSKTLMHKVIKQLNLNIFYYEKTGLQSTELYGNLKPFELVFLNKHDSIFHDIDSSFIVRIKSNTEFEIETQDKEIRAQSFGNIFESNFGKIMFSSIGLIDDNIGKEYIINIYSIQAVANSYNKRLKLEAQDKKSSLLNLKLTDAIYLKAQDILNTLVMQYNKDAIDYKNSLAENTDRFINNRIIDISVELSNVDKGVENYKTGNKLTDMVVESGIALNSNAEVERKIIDLSSRQKMVEYLLDHIRSNPNDLIPTNLSIQDGKTIESAIFYNQLMLERNRIIKNSSKINPTVINIDDQLKTLRLNIEQSLINLQSSITISLNDAKNQEFKINSKRALAPRQEREFQDIKRKQQIYETLYLYLLEKREENAISIGIPVPIARVIDKAYVGDFPIWPRKKLTILAAIFIGALIPFSVIYSKSLLDTKIHSISDLEQLISAPILGEISKSNNKNLTFIDEKDVSGYAESYRLLRTNLQFMFLNNDKKCKCILVTSSIPGEGKSTISINLSSILASIDKNVLLIEADLRKPKLSKYLKQSDHLGLTNYLVNQELQINKVILKDESFNFDLIPAGNIPPNPSTLLMNNRLEDIFLYANEHYDFVIIDTPPVTAVSDAQVLSRFSDLTVYVVRANYVDRRLLKLTSKIHSQHFKNLAMVLNESDKKNRGYTYGYEEENSKKSWFSSNS